MYATMRQLRISMEASDDSEKRVTAKKVLVRDWRSGSVDNGPLNAGWTSIWCNSAEFPFCQTGLCGEPSFPRAICRSRAGFCSLVAQNLAGSSGCG